MISNKHSLAIMGCTINPLESTKCDAYIQGIAGHIDPSVEWTGLDWVLAHGDYGVTWGRYDAQTKGWSVGSQVAPEISPLIQPETLHELRMFGKEKEILIWRTASGFLGRMVEDTTKQQTPPNATDPLKPTDESRILRGNRVYRSYNSNFTQVVDGTGAEQILPLQVTDEQLQQRSIRILVRHYYTQEESTGAVRIALTRLVQLQGGHHGC